MDRDELVAHCLGKPGAEETYPWGEEELVAKVGGKGFAFIGLEGGTVSVKCGRDAAEAAEWRDRYPGAVTMSHYVGPLRLERRRLDRSGARRRGPRADRRLLRRRRRRAAEEPPARARAGD